MDWEKHDIQMGEIQDLLDRLDPSSEDYEKCVKRLSEMYDIQIKMTELYLKQERQEKEFGLEEAKLEAQIEEGKGQKRVDILRTVIDASKTGLYVVSVVGLGIATIYAEEFRIINSGGLKFLNFLRPKL